MCVRMGGGHGRWREEALENGVSKRGKAGVCMEVMHYINIFYASLFRSYQ